MKSKLGIALLWVFVFLLGAIAGAVTHYLTYRNELKAAQPPPRPPKPGEIQESIVREFHLDGEQRELLKQIFHQGRVEFRQLGEENKTRWEAIRNEIEEKVKNIMRPDQRAKYEEFLRNFYAKEKAARSKAQQQQQEKSQ
jgi:uncharacterized membrane protein